MSWFPPSPILSLEPRGVRKEKTQFQAAGDKDPDLQTRVTDVEIEALVLGLSEPSS